MNKYLPLILSLTILIIVAFLWDYIQLPYNKENTIIGEYYYKKFNPLNEIVRFSFFIILPCIIYLTAYLKFNKETYSLRPSHENYFLKKKEKIKEVNLNTYFYLFIFLITLEFFLLDFSRYMSPVDIFHEGVYLVPPLNFLKTNELFKSTLYDYGFIANNIGLVPKFLIGYYTIGSISFIKLTLTFFIKFTLILISKKAISYLDLNIFLKKILFIFFVFIVISSIDYYDMDSYFNFRHSLYLVFIFLLISAICENNYSEIKFFTIGIFSLLSILWWLDIGAFTNALILFTIIFLLIHKEKKKLLFLLSGIFFSWTLFFLILPSEEMKEFLFLIKISYTGASEYILGLEYPKPFSSESGRWTKALIIIYLSALMIINLNFSKSFYYNYQTKIFSIIIFISGVFAFKSALMRSDSFHIKYSSGLYTFIFLFVILLFIFKRLELNMKINTIIFNLKNNSFTKIISIFFFIGSVLFLLDLNNKNNSDTASEKIQNFLKAKKNIITLVKAEDQLYLDEKTISVLKYYKKISTSDKCIQVMTDDTAFPYLLRKPSCTQFYISSQIIKTYTEDKFINQLNEASPNYILYKSPNKILGNNLNMPKALKFINEKYSFFNEYNGYIFYKLK